MDSINTLILSQQQMAPTQAKFFVLVHDMDVSNLISIYNSVHVFPKCLLLLSGKAIGTVPFYFVRSIYEPAFIFGRVLKFLPP